MILCGDALEKLHELPDESVQCCVTSPPYWGLRDYGVEGQIGLESTPEAYVERIVEVFREVRRVLRDDGTLWLNLGDSHAASRSYQVPDTKHPACDEHHKGSHRVPPGLKPKDLVGIPWMVAFALRADSWYLRSDIIWHKNNCMPESVADRPTKSHEYIFLLSKRERYFFDADAVREPQSALTFERFKPGQERSRLVKSGGSARKNESFHNSTKVAILPNGRNIRSVWTIATQPYPESHFATFPEALVERCIAAGSHPGDTVLDPFLGSGTVGEVAERMGRKWIGIELNGDYVRLAEKRTAQKGLGL